MTAIMMRSWFERNGPAPPPDLAYLVSDYHGRRVVTWSEVHAERRKRQRQILERKRGGPPERAYKLWIAFFDQDIFGGWHAFLETYGGHAWNSGSWIDRDRPWLRKVLMEAFPFDLQPSLWHLQEPERERELFALWKIAFAERYRRREQDGEPVGVAYLWWNGWSRSVRPAAEALP